MTATRFDLPIVQGEDLDFTVTVYADEAHTVVQNMTGWTTKMQIKPSKTAATTYASYTTELTINGPAGQVTLHVPGATTASYTWTAGVYDLFVYGPSNVPTKRVLYGDATVSARVTV